MNPNAEKIYDLALRQLNAGEYELAYGVGSSAIKQFPEHASLLQLTALAAFQIGLASEAIELCERAWEISPNNYILAYNLATILLHQHNANAGRQWLSKSIELKPDYAAAHANMGSVLIAFGELEQALVHLDKCIELGEQTSEVLINRASALRDLGELNQAIAGYKDAIDIDPESSIAHSNYLLCLNYAENNPEQIKEAHEKWGARYSIETANQSLNARPEKIRIGYVSPDFRRHSVAFFLESVLQNHNQEKFEIICISNTQREDAVTASFKELAHDWVDIKNLTTTEAKEAVQQAGIHILVDLAAHTAHNRLDIFAQRSAPIQATWLGYPNTTGLTEMDYRIGDIHTDPPGFEKHYTEELIYLPDTFICFSPPAEYPDLAEDQTQAKDHVTFGSFNLLPKVTEEVVKTWAEILNQVPGSKLLLKSRQLTSQKAQERYLNLFQSYGIEPERITLRAHVNSLADHLNLYQEIDIGLDPFPYNGTTTTCEALLMGTPVLTLAGNRHSCRVGASLLTAAQLPNWIATDLKEYVAKAVHFASSKRPQRASIRQKFQESPLCDTKRFTKNLENLFEKMVVEKLR